MDDTEQTFLIDMFAPRKSKFERVIEFQVDSTISRSLQQSGLRIEPGEAVQVEGIQAQEAVSAAAEKGEGKLQVRELLKEELQK